ncbi:MAG: outer membrane beta-barrel family protein [Paramuribaculum sp.]|nr:outer membrane beta-barrel family protein [Paramuribaculum sp.]
MKRFYFIAILISFIFFQIEAQINNTFIIRANVIDGWTGEAVDGVKAFLLSDNNTDTIHSTISSVMKGTGGNMIRYVSVNFNVPKTPASYMLKAYLEDYDTVYSTVNIDKVGSRENLIVIPDLEFYKKSKNLEGATVTATKVKFYMAGDTLVYNADAFKLPEGSMLDALIKQMPGVEMNDNGEIFVNGKKVESLLLNGKDFFKGNKLIMLNNLGAYTVNKVKVYDKLSERSQLAGTNLGDTEYVMDVNLKKQFLNGYIGNIEAGGGTANRYMGRLFGMWYTNRSRITVLGSINNLNDNRNPGQNTAWQATTTPGDTRTKMAGIEYNVNGSENKWEVSGDATVQHTRSFNTADTYTTNFHPERQTYGTSFANSLSRNLDVKTKHTLKLRPNNKIYSANAFLNYNNSDFNSYKLSGTFNSASEQLTQALLEQIFNGSLSSFADYPVYTSLTNSLSSGHSIESGGSILSEFKIPHSPDLISFAVSGKYKHKNSGEYNLYDINYNASANRSLDYQYINNHPDRSWSVGAKSTYTYVITEYTSINISPGWNHNSSTKDSYLYQLDRLGDIGVFGILPDYYRSSLNYDQTYLSTQTKDEAYVSIHAFNIINWGDKKSFTYLINADLDYSWRKLDYHQGDVHQLVSRNSFYVQVPYSYIQYSIGNTFQLKLNYSRNTQLIELNRLVNVVDTRDPLNIFIASGKLKNAASNNFDLEWRTFGFSKHRWSNLISLKYSFTENALTNSYLYNPDTGVRTYQMQNVNGNWNANLTESFSKTFGKMNQFLLSSTSSAGYGKTTGMLAMTGTDFTKNIVSNLILNQTINFNWSIGKQKIGLKGGIKWRDTHGTDSGFKNFSATDAYYGINGVFSLPCRFGISTDLTFYSRNGYTASSINSTKAVWNGRITYTVKGGKWLIMLDGFDLLHQLDNVTYNVNDQAQTEVYTNVLPRYGLLHIQYKFAIQPKKK